MTWRDVWRLFKKTQHEKKPYIESARKRAEPEGGTPDPIIRAIQNARESLLEQMRASDEQSQRNEDRNYCVAKWAVIGAWIYAGIAALQFGGMLYLNSLTNQSITLANRAWLIVRAVQPMPTTFEPGVARQFAIIVENTGKSPAYNQWGTSLAKTFGGPIPPSIELATPQQLPPSRGVFGSGHPQPIFVDADPLTKNDTDSIKRGTTTFVILGRIVYDDALGTARETRYCLYYDITPPGSFRFCPVHNAVR